MLRRQNPNSIRGIYAVGSSICMVVSGLLLESMGKVESPLGELTKNLFRRARQSGESEERGVNSPDSFSEGLQQFKSRHVHLVQNCLSVSWVWV